MIGYPFLNDCTLCGIKPLGVGISLTVTIDWRKVHDYSVETLGQALAVAMYVQAYMVTDNLAGQDL